jgi:GDPmannose 4,6-dehydratase
MNNIAFITGITGQDGSYLAELLMEKGYVIHGLIHRPDRLSSSYISKYIKDEAIINKRLFLHNGSYDDSTHLRRIIAKAKPSEFYHLAGQSSPRVSLEMPESTMESIGMGTLRIMEILRDLQEPPKFLFASSSEVFGTPLQMPQTEETPMNPATPYGAAKAAARHLVKVYRESYSIYAVQGWLFNHEGTRRGEEFVTRKITKAVARIKQAIDREEAYDLLELGNIESKRDWSDAEDFVDGVWKMLNQQQPREYVLSSNETHTIREFVELAFEAAGIQGYWLGSGINEIFLQKETERVLMVINEKFYRPAEVELLLGDSTKARQELGWKPKTSFKNLIDKMVFWDIMLLDGKE